MIKVNLELGIGVRNDDPILISYKIKIENIDESFSITSTEQLDKY